MESTNLLKILQDCELFNDIEPGDFYLLLHYGKLRHFQEGQSIYRRGDQARGMFCIIVSGRAGITAENGQIITYVGPGEIIGEIGVTSSQNKRIATVRAVQPTEVFEWNARLIQGQVPDLIERLKKLAQERVADYYE